MSALSRKRADMLQPRLRDRCDAAFGGGPSGASIDAHTHRWRVRRAGRAACETVRSPLQYRRGGRRYRRLHLVWCRASCTRGTVRPHGATHVGSRAGGIHGRCRMADRQVWHRNQDESRLSRPSSHGRRAPPRRRMSGAAAIPGSRIFGSSARRGDGEPDSCVVWRGSRAERPEAARVIRYLASILAHDDVMRPATRQAALSAPAVHSQASDLLREAVCYVEQNGPEHHLPFW